MSRAETEAAASGAGDTLQEVIITAEKRSEDLQKTSISIQVTSGEELRAEGKQRIDDIMAGVAGVQAQGSEVGTSFFMRGVGRNDGVLGPPGGGAPTQAAVAVILDGVYQSRSETVRGGSLDVSQVEVMRGPQSTTLGGSAFAGAVSMVTNKPSFDYEARGTVEVGNYHTLNTEGVLNAPLSSTLALRLAASTNKHDGYYSSGADDSDLTNVRGKLRWQPNDNLDMVLTVAHQLIGGQDVLQGALSYQGFWVPWQQCTQSGLSGAAYNCSDTTEGAGVMSHGYPATYGHVDNNVTYLNRSNPWDDGLPPDQFGHPSGFSTTITQYYGEVDWKLPIGNLTIVPSYESGNFTTAEYGGPAYWAKEHQSYKTTQIDAHLDSLPGSALTWVLGANYYNYNLAPGDQVFIEYPGQSNFFGSCAATPSNLCYFWTTYTEDKQVTDSAYANLKYSVVGALRVIGGLRYTKDEKSLVTQTNPPGVGGPPFLAGDAVGPGSAPPYVGDSGDWSAVNYRAGLEYDLGPKAMAYGTYSTGYQPGNVLEQGPVFIHSPKETINQVTIGFKSRLLDDTLQFNVEAFNATYHNRQSSNTIVATRTNSLGTAPTACAPVNGPGQGQLQVPGSDFTCVTLNSNALTIPTLISRGVDLDLNWLVTRDDVVNASLEYLKATQDAPVSSVTLSAAQLASIGGTSVITDPAASNDAAGLLSALNSVIATYNGATLQASPKWSGNLTYRHSFRFASHGTLAPELNMTYKSSYWVAQGGLSQYTPQNPGPAEQSAYELYNAAVRWSSEDSKFQMSLFVKNIANKPVLDSWNDVSGFRGPAFVSLEAPRTFGLIASVKL